MFNVDGVAYPLTVEEAWKLREHLRRTCRDWPASPRSFPFNSKNSSTRRTGSTRNRRRSTSSTPRSQQIRMGLDRWLNEVKANAFPARAMDLRYALFVEELGALAFRDIVFCFEDGHETYELNVLVTGDPFEHEERWWTPQDWRRLHGIDEIDGELHTWLRCREIPPQDRRD